MNPTRLLYESIAALKDIQSQVANTADGESTIFEFKEIVSAIGSDDKKVKSLIAKEICAFLNSNDGILCIGIKNDGGVLKISNAYSGSLEDLIDKSISSLFEPSPSGILTKTIKSGTHSFVVVYIPFSNVAPHRVAANKSLESDVQKNYYTRMMSNSVPMPEHLIKAMYLSNGRLPNLEAYPVIAKLSPSYIEIQHFIKPDKFKFIKKDEYYTEMKAILFDGNFNIMHFEDSDVIDIENSFNSALHPSDKGYLLNTHTLYQILDENLQEKDKEQNTFFPVISIPQYEIPDIANDQTKLREAGFNAIYAIYIQTSIACEGMPLKTNHTLFYLTEAWHRKLVPKDDAAEFINLGNFKDVQVYIPKDVDQTKMPLNGIDECIDKIDASFE